MIHAKRADLAARAEVAPTATKPRAARPFGAIWALWTIRALGPFATLRAIQPLWAIWAFGARLNLAIRRAISPGLHQSVLLVSYGIADSPVAAHCDCDPSRRIGTYIISSII
jgi:hypothetical protein